MDKKNIKPFKQENLLKSNFFIGMKYKSKPLEDKIVFLSMLAIQKNEFEEKEDGLYVKLSASEIKKSLNIKSGHFYTNLKSAAAALTATNYGYVDDNSEQFVFITIINKAEYKDGELILRFPKELKNELVGVRRKFTSLPKESVMSLNKSYTYPLYQLLKSQCYYPATYNGPKENVFAVEIGLSELKLDMGVVNSNLKSVRDVLSFSKGSPTDYDKAVDKSPEQLYRRWGDFNKRCLKPAIEEINEKTDIYVEYTKITSGYGGKVKGVDFTVWLNEAEKQYIDNKKRVVLDEDETIQIKMDDSDKFMFHVNVMNLFADYAKLPYEDIVSISEEAEYNMEKINQAKKALQASNSVIDNITGWIISAIRDSYSINQIKQNKTNFNSFSEREDLSEKDILELNGNIFEETEE